jgi:hypothetical protein
MRFIAVGIAVLVLMGCATDARHVKPVLPTKDLYVGLDCIQLEQACNNEAQNLRLYISKQQAKRNSDRHKVVLDFVVFPVFWNLGNTENLENLQLSMGRYEAVCKKMIEQRCNYQCKPIPEIIREKQY